MRTNKEILDEFGRIIRLVFLTLIVVSCNKTTKKIYLNNISISISDILRPSNNKLTGYSASKFILKWHVNDTINVGFKSFFQGEFQSFVNYKLIGTIDTIYMDDYYGDGIKVFYYKPNKATRGDIEIEYGLY